MRTLLFFLLAPFLLFGCALIIIWAPLPAPFPEALSRGRNQLAAASTGLLAIGYMGAILWGVFQGFTAPARRADAAFTPLGLSGGGYAFLGRQFAGSYESRAMRVTVQPARNSYVLLNIYLDSSSDQRAALSRRAPILLDCRDCETVPDLPPALAGSHVVAADPAWLQAQLTDPALVAALAALLADDALFDRGGAIFIQPDRLWLRAEPARTEPAAAARWLAALAVIAAAVEA